MDDIMARRLLWAVIIGCIFFALSPDMTQASSKIFFSTTGLPSAAKNRHCLFSIDAEMSDGTTRKLPCRVDDASGNLVCNIIPENSSTHKTNDNKGIEITYFSQPNRLRDLVSAQELANFLRNRIPEKQGVGQAELQRAVDGYTVLEVTAHKEMFKSIFGRAPDKQFALLANDRPWEDILCGDSVPMVLFDSEEIPRTPANVPALAVGTAPHAHYAWFYPSSCVTLPESAGSDKIKELTDTIDALRRSTRAKVVYVYLLGFADRQESHASEARQEDERNYNLIVSRARVLAWKKLLEGKYGGKGQHPWLRIASYWFGQDYDNEQQKAAWWPAEANPYKRLLANGQPSLDYNRRVEIIVSSGPNPLAAAGWVQAWNQGNYHVSDDGRDGIWRKYKSGSRQLIKTDQNVSLKALAAVEDGLRGFDSSLVDPEDAQP